MYVGFLSVCIICPRVNVSSCFAVSVCTLLLVAECESPEGLKKDHLTLSMVLKVHTGDIYLSRGTSVSHFGGVERASQIL